MIYPKPKMKFTLDRLEFYISKINVKGFDSIPFRVNSNHISGKRYYRGLKAFSVIETTPFNTLSTKDTFNYLVQINPADFQNYSELTSYLLDFIPYSSLKSSIIHRIDPSVCIKRSNFYNSEIFRNSIRSGYSRQREAYIYLKTKRGLIENLTFGSKNSRLVIYDLALKYPTRRKKNHYILKRKTGEVSAKYLCFERQIKRNTIKHSHIHSYFDLPRLANFRPYRWIRFFDTKELIESCGNEFDEKHRKLAHTIIRHGLHDGLNHLDKDGHRNMMREYKDLLKEAVVGYKYPKTFQDQLNTGFAKYCEFYFDSVLEVVEDHLNPPLVDRSQKTWANTGLSSQAQLQ